MASKRPNSEDSQEFLEAKKPKLDPENNGTFHLLDFSDDILLMILSHVSNKANDILNVTQTCSRLSNICGEKSLWKNVSYEPPFTTRGFRKMIQYLNEKTETVCIKGHINSGPLPKKEPLTPSTLKLLVKNSPNIKEFKLTECFIDADIIKMDMFPQDINVLDLSYSEFTNVTDKAHYFKDMHLKMPLLTVVNLCGCKWLANHALYALCKCENLQELYLKGCLRMGECPAYTSLSCRFGFPSLKKVDIRDTSVGNSEVTCFGRLPKLTHFYIGYTSKEFSGIHDRATLGDRDVVAIQNHGNDDPHSSKLELLSITYTNVTNQKIFELAQQLKMLKELNVVGTRVTEEGVLNVKSVLPNCKIRFDPTQCQLKENGEPYKGQQDEVVFFVAHQ